MGYCENSISKVKPALASILAPFEKIGLFFIPTSGHIVGSFIGVGQDTHDV